NEPRVRYFLMGANEWRTCDGVPTHSHVESWYLHGGRSGTARSLNDGVLAPQWSPSQDRPDTFRYNPAKPVPTLGGNTLYAPPPGGNPRSAAPRAAAAAEAAPNFALTAGPRDQPPVEPLCLTYTSDRLKADLDVVGEVWVQLYVSSSCVDTDFVARLCDVYP